MLNKHTLKTLHQKYKKVDWIQRNGSDAARQAITAYKKFDGDTESEDAWFGVVELDGVQYFTFSTGNLRDDNTFIWYVPVIRRKPGWPKGVKRNPEQKPPGPKPGSDQIPGSGRKAGPPSIKFQITIPGPKAEVARQKKLSLESIKESAFAAAIEYIEN